MRKILFAGLLLLTIAADAQWRRNVLVIRPRMGMGMRQPMMRRPQRPKLNLPEFKPYVALSAGYGFPNLDKEYLAEFYGVYKGTVSQTGPVSLAIDYHFNRYMSIGLMGMYGKVSAPYYDSYNNQLFTGKLENSAILLNFVRYMPSTKAVTPYLRTAIGVNIWNQSYNDNAGNKVGIAADPTSLAYQVGIGAQIRASSNTSFFMEAGYGKYILHAGLSLKL